MRIIHEQGECQKDFPRGGQETVFLLGHGSGGATGGGIGEEVRGGCPGLVERQLPGASAKSVESGTKSAYSHWPQHGANYGV